MSPVIISALHQFFSLIKTMVFFRNARDSRLLPFLLKRTIFITKFPWWVLVAKLRNLFHDTKAWVFKVVSKYISTFLVSLVKKKNHSRPFQNFSTDKFNCRRGNRSFCFRILKHQSSSFSVLLMCTSIGNIPLSFMKELFMKKSMILILSTH